MRGGKSGSAGYHGCMCDAFRESVDYQFTCGGCRVAHPGNIVDYRPTSRSPDDPIMHGILELRLSTSEHDGMHVDPANWKCWRQRDSPLLCALDHRAW